MGCSDGVRAWLSAGRTVSGVEPTFALFQLELAEVLTTGYCGKVLFDLTLDGANVLFPCLDHFEHGWRWGWVAFFLAVVVKIGVVMSEKRVLDHDLRSKKTG